MPAKVLTCPELKTAIRGRTAEGPALKGATNLVLGPVDHRETAYSPRAFREIYKFIAGREPRQDRYSAGAGSQG